MQSLARARSLIPVTVLLAALCGRQTATGAEPAPVAAAGGLPSWVVEMSVSAKESYDTNVQGASAQGVSATVPLAVANETAWVSTVGARFLFSLSDLGGLSKKLLVVGYAPTVFDFAGASSENNTQHRFLLQSSGKASDFSWSLDSSTLYVDGSRDSLGYTNVSAFGAALPRERRAQWQYADKLWVRCEAGNLFVRGCGNLLAYDLLTHHYNTAAPNYRNWQNFIDRYDINGGFDLGWKVTKDAALTLGWRNGYQYQQAFAWSPAWGYNTSNHYQRVLLGLEGKLAPWLTVNVSGGPDYRRFDQPDARRGIVATRPTFAYVDGSVTAALGKNDSLVLLCKRWHWVSSVAKVIYDDHLWSLAWKHTFSPAWSLQLTGQALRAKYDTYPTAISGVPRDDNLRIGTLQIQWVVNKQLTLVADYSLQQCYDTINLPACVGRDYHRQVTGVSAKYSF